MLTKRQSCPRTRQATLAVANLAQSCHPERSRGDPYFSRKLAGWWTIAITTERFLCACTIRHIREQFYGSGDKVGYRHGQAPRGNSGRPLARPERQRRNFGRYGAEAGRCPGHQPELWTGMQTQYDLWQASKRRRKRVSPFFTGVGRAMTPPWNPTHRKVRDKWGTRLYARCTSRKTSTDYSCTTSEKKQAL